MKLRVGLILALVLAVAAIASASGGSEAATKAGPPPKIVFSKPIWGDKPVDFAANELVRAEISKRLNINLVVVGKQNPSDQEEMPRLMLASGEQLDLFNVGDWRPYTKSGAIRPLNDLYEKYGKDILVKAKKESISNRYDASGKIWAVPYEQFPVSVVVMMRGDWLDALGLKVPKTIEQYEKVVQAFKEKYNDEGFVPLWPFAHDSSFVGAYVKNGQQNFLDSDGKIKPYFLDPGYKDMLAKMAEWYKKGYLHKEIATMSYQQATDTFDSGRSGAMMNWLKSIEMNEKLLTDKVPQGRLIGLPPLAANQPGMYGSDLPSGWGTVITSSSKNPEAAMKFINWSTATDEGYLLATYGLEGSQWNWKDKASGVINFANDKDKIMGGAGDESPFNTGILAYYGGKFATSLRDKDFMNWLNGPEVRSQFPVDLGVNYDVDSMGGKDKFGAIATLIDEARWKIIVGEQPVSSWDDAVKSWLKEGGEEWIAGYTAQYKAARAK